MEIWKDVPGYEGIYQVSSVGTVKSLNFKRSGKEKILKPWCNKGYLQVSLCNGSRDTVRKFEVHQLVAMAFLGHKPNRHKLVIDHINHNPSDNRVENLQIITNRENLSKDRRGYSSKYVGVSWEKSRNKWQAGIVINGKSVHLGRFENEIDAHNRYQEKLKEILNEKKI